MDQGPWFVRVAHNQVSVGIFACDEEDLPRYVDEVCDVEGCEYRRMPPGGFIFGGDVVLHKLDPESHETAHMDGAHLTEGWCEVYRDEPDWLALRWQAA
jgi:hypothetical protein